MVDTSPNSREEAENPGRWKEMASKQALCIPWLSAATSSFWNGIGILKSPLKALGV